jgi:hypothetical protein
VCGGGGYAAFGAVMMQDSCAEGEANMWYGGGGNTDNMGTVQRPRQQACFSQYVCLKNVTRLLLSLFAKLIMSSFFVLE